MLNISHTTTQSNATTQTSAGFTMIELLVAIATIGVILLLAVPLYRGYLTSAGTVDLVDAVEALELEIRSPAQPRRSLVTCDDTLVHAANLVSSQATLAIVPVLIDDSDPTAGYGAGLSVVSVLDKHGSEGISIASEFLKEVKATRHAALRPGSLDSDSIVNFTILLSDLHRPMCDANQSIASQTVTPPTQPGPAQAPQSVPQPAVATAPSLAAAQVPDLSFSFTTSQEVLEFPESGRGAVINNGPLKTGGGMRHLAAEFNVMGGNQVQTHGYHGATFLSYGVAGNPDEFYAWRPNDLTVRIKGAEYRTGIDTTDGQSHRYTILWSSDTGRLQVLADGVVQFTQDNIANGYEIPGGGVLTLAQDQDHFQIEDGSHSGSHGFSTDDAFHGQFFSAAMANANVDPADLTDKPLSSVVHKNSGLITDIRMEGGAPVDLTGNHQFTTTALASKTVPVDTSIAIPNPGATLELTINLQPKGADQLTGLQIAGFLPGTRLSDASGNSATGASHDILNWDYQSLTARLPAGVAENMRIAVKATVRGPAGDSQTAEVNRSLVLDPAKTVP